MSYKNSVAPPFLLGTLCSHILAMMRDAAGKGKGIRCPPSRCTRALKRWMASAIGALYTPCIRPTVLFLVSNES